VSGVVDYGCHDHWQKGTSIAVELHQSFEFDVIAAVQVEPGKTYRLDESRVTAWLVREPRGLSEG
jgi:hypothetical protein